MSIKLRKGTAADAAACGTIRYKAFKTVCTAHRFLPDVPSAEVAKGALPGLLGRAGFYSVVAELDSRVVGSHFLDERSRINGGWR